ncbi:PAS domain S-box protein [Caulobacter sp.]|uniref:PAS domain S-box protein n=1 Tax=Caulobacter sp. TaxID=78 RepID=UPI0031D9717A
MNPDPEVARLAALKSYRVLDTPPEDVFDEITARAAALFDAPISLVSLVDDHRQWFKSRQGLEACSTSREVAFCAHALQLEPHGVLIVEDSAKDPRFAQNPLAIDEPFVKFYVGAVLTSDDGHNLGTLCVIDNKPRPRPDQNLVEQLKILASLVVARLEARRAQHQSREQGRLLAMTETISGVGHWRADLTERTVTWSDEVYRIYGRDPATFTPGVDMWLNLVHPDDQGGLRVRLRDALAGEPQSYKIRILRGDGAFRTCFGRATCEFDADGKAIGVFGVLEDITDREAATVALKRSRAGYKLLAASMADTVARIRFDGASDYVSPAVQSLIGWTPEEMAGQGALDFVHTDDRWLVSAALQRLAKGQDVATVRHRAVHRDGHAIWVETRFRLAQSDEDGRFDTVAVIRDISDRKALEDQLQASEARSRKILANAHQAIVTMDGEGKVTGWNRFAEQTFGWSSSEMFGKPLTDFIIPLHRRQAQLDDLAGFIRTGHSAFVDQRVEVPALRKSGEAFTIELAISAERGPDGWSFTALMHDISARKAQAALFETAFHNAAVGIALVSPEGGFARVNSAYCDIVGYSAEEMLAVDFQTITHPADLDNDLELLNQLVAGQIPNYHMDKRYIRKDGAVVWVRLSVSMVANPDGSPKHFIAQAQDLTARVEAQEALERQTEHLATMAVQLAAAKDDAEAATLAKAEFLANMSHELRTPLNGVVGFSRLLAEEAMSPSARRKVDRIRSAGETLSSLINDILDFSKLEAGAVELEASAFNFDDFVTDSIAFVEPQAGERRVTVNASGNPVGWVVGDQLRLRQILLNLLSNAVKFTREGAVNVRTKVVQAGGVVRLRLEVVDEGVGIAPEAIDRLFTRFAQADGSITRVFGGTGLGLAICSELVELMGGRIGVESMIGQGSTFWVDLVLFTADPVVQPIRSDVEHGDYIGRVLLVDDVELNRELAEELLKRRGLMVDVACDGAEAVQAVSRQRYDLVLMDLHMPVLDGLAATREIAALGLDCGPVIALTASNTEVQVAACRQAGMVGHLLKPFHERELDKLLADHLRPDLSRIAGEPALADLCGEARARDDFVQALGKDAAVKLGGLLLVQLDGKFQSDDVAVLESDGHSLAGSAGLLGFDTLGADARKVESACAAGLGVHEAVAQARASAAAAREVLTAWLETLGAGR